ncbi:MAG: F0F1 ATP synthase subunit A [Planctomycetes bacterium]|jgi:F-type H+-transporting ATPase subunit a|nr:F0F1 ATP synthase subunit A [Planctomycetota bacterium]MBT6451732.1 F0F1 ATP synthase subunit A [Planctomycetota bacterium]MBT6541001.1 F0F1 ATP synthase subunit A [Planctomycetota bacterium]MBT6783902.1 F0F1 ATP synthase subunit A [Planctomycetota bacterium]MBT6968741.1 F0F1 ATP synthase subunit A [Planctomycetota bacterium]
MNGLMMTLASSDPLSHVLDHDLHWLTDNLQVTKHVLMLVVSALVCVAIFPMIAKKIAGGVPGGRTAGLFEVVLLYIRDEMVKPFLGDDTQRFLPLIWTFFFVILFCNLLGLIPGSATATGNISVTAGLAVISLVTYHFVGVQRNGLIPYLKANLLVGPAYLWPLMIPIEIGGHIIKPCALAIRLFANMVGGHIMLAVILGFAGIISAENMLTGSVITVVSVLSSVMLTFLELLVAFIQAYIFAFLTTVFLSLALHPEH